MIVVGKDSRKDKLVMKADGSKSQLYVMLHTTMAKSQSASI